MSEWISVNDNLPEPLELVLIHYQGKVREGIRLMNTWAVGETQVSDVTHWMPLPEPPTQTEGEG